MINKRVNNFRFASFENRSQTESSAWDNIIKTKKLSLVLMKKKKHILLPIHAITLKYSENGDQIWKRKGKIIDGMFTFYIDLIKGNCLYKNDYNIIKDWTYL